MKVARDVRILLERQPRAGAWIATSSLSSVLAGSSTASLVAITHRAIERGDVPTSWLWAFAGLCAGHAVFGVIATYSMTRVLEGVLLSLRLELGARTLSAPLRNLERVGRATLLSAFTQVAFTIGEVMNVVPGVLSRIVMLTGLFGYLAWVSPTVFVSVLGLLVVGGVLSAGPLGLLRRAKRAHLEAYEAHLGQFHRLVHGQRELLQSWSRSRRLLDRELEPTGQEVLETSLRANTVQAGIQRGEELFALFGLGALLFALPAAGLLDQAEAARAVIVLLFVFAPLATVIHFATHYQKLRAALGQLAELEAQLDPDPHGLSHEPPPALVPAGVIPTLELEEVSYGYDAFTFGPASLRLEGPAIVFVTGGNGSGKSTLAKLLCGLYAPQTGVIRCEGQAVTDRERESYRQLFSVVFFDFFLFTELLHLDDPDLDARARGVLELLELHERVTVRGGELSTVDLSQGQRKRLTLLHAWLEGRPVCVFDEWAADQDPVFKRTFYERLLPRLRDLGKLVVVITHDQEHFGCADRVLRLVDGQLVEAPA